MFGLYSDAECKSAVTDSSGDDITATSDSQGIVTFTKLEPGTYYIKEISAPEGYLLDTGVYTVVVKANDTTTTFTDSSGTVYNKKNAATLTFVKYLLSTDANGDLVRVAVDQTRIDSDFTGGVFVLQYYDEDSNTWVTLTDRTITLERSTDSNNVTISSDDLEGLPVYTGSSATKAYQYRIVETLPTNYSLVELFEGTDDGDDINATSSTDVATGETLAITNAFTLESGDTTISMTNQTTGEISVKKQYIKAGTSGATTSTADDTTAVTVYLLKKSGNAYTCVGTTTTGSSGDVTISGVNILGSDNTSAQEYYWAEATSNTAYSSYALEGGTTIDVDVDGDGTDETVYLLGTVAYASAYDSEDTETMLTNILPYVRVQLFKKSTATDNFVSGAGYTIYRVTDNGNEVLYTSGTVESGGSSIVLKAGYVYHVYETTVPCNYTGLTTYDGTSSIGNYMEIDLTSAVPDERGDDGVTRGTYAADTTLYDTPYPTLTLTKNLVTVNGTTVSTSSGYGATFKVYRSETADGTYKLYKNSYTANSPVSLEPGYYYAFVENVSSSNIAPEVYPGTSGTSVSGATLKQITLSDGTTAYAYVTTEMIESGDNGAAKSYSIATVTNYENSSSVTLTKYA